MKIFLLITIILIGGVNNSTYSQFNYKPGCIITNKQDTIHGKIKFKRDLSLCKSCIFKLGKSEIQEYLPGEIKAYRINNSRFYESYNLEGENRFLEVLFRGAVSIYYHVDKQNESYYIKKDTGKLKLLRSFKKVVYVTNKGELIDEKDFNIKEYDTSTWNQGKTKAILKFDEYKFTLDTVMQDVPSMKSEIKQMDNVVHKELIAVAKKYHELKTDNQDYSVFHSRKKDEIEFSLGWINVDYLRLNSNNNYKIYSFKGYTPLKSSDLYFGYGLQYAPLEFQTINYHIFKLPISLSYIYPGNIIRPYFSLGFNTYGISEKYRHMETSFSMDTFLPAYGIGLSVKVYKGLQLTANVEGDLNNINIFTAKKFSQTKNVGVRFAF